MPVGVPVFGSPMAKGVPGPVVVGVPELPDQLVVNIVHPPRVQESASVDAGYSGVNNQDPNRCAKALVITGTGFFIGALGGVFAGLSPDGIGSSAGIGVVVGASCGVIYFCTQSFWDRYHYPVVPA